MSWLIYYCSCKCSSLMKDNRIIYRFSNVEFSENDSISLEFIKYYSADTINFTSGCIDGTESKSNSQIFELNSDCHPIIQLPEKIFIQLNGNEIVMTKQVVNEIIVNSGHGKKFEKNWGVLKTTFTKQVIYSNVN